MQVSRGGLCEHSRARLARAHRGRPHVLRRPPGGVQAPFKLTRELLEVMDSNPDGKASDMFDYFKVGPAAGRMRPPAAHLAGRLLACSPGLLEHCWSS